MGVKILRERRSYTDTTSFSSSEIMSDASIMCIVVTFLLATAFASFDYYLVACIMSVIATLCALFCYYYILRASKKYIEYLIVDTSLGSDCDEPGVIGGNPDSVFELNSLGKDGWELMAINPCVGQYGTTYRFYFRRFTCNKPAEIE